MRRTDHTLRPVVGGEMGRRKKRGKRRPTRNRLRREMSEHKFKIGQAVFFRPRASRRIDTPLNRPYQVTQRLPDAPGAPQYQIRCTLTGKEFAAGDSELRVIA